MIKNFILFLGIFIILFAAFVFIADRFFRSSGWDGPITDHFDGKKFKNIGDEKTVVLEKAHSRWDVFRWMVTRDKNVFTQREVAQTKPPERVFGKEIKATFINHATVLIQTAGLNIITDPMYGNRASPVSFMGPKRYAAPGVAFDNLPPIDIVLLSHNHYDHLDLGTLQKIKAKFDPVFLVPLGNKVFLKSKGIDAAELDWWSVFSMEGGVSITFVPAQHFSSRSVSDRDTSLWGGYVIGAPDGDIYFAGDTGYGPFISEIKKRYEKGFRLGFIPIGAFKPEWFMSPVHVSPEEALQMKSELRVEKAVGIHFGTFKLADDGQDEATTTLDALGKSKNVDSFITLPNGGSIDLK